MPEQNWSTLVSFFILRIYLLMSSMAYRPLVSTGWMRFFVLLVLPSITAMKSSVTTRPSSVFSWLLLAWMLCSIICISGLLHIIKEYRNEVSPADTAERLFDGAPCFGFIPEEKLALCQFLFLRVGAVHGFQCIGIVTGVPGLCTHGHGCGRKVLNLFQMEVQFTGDDCQLSHIRLMAAWMTADEIRDNLLVDAFFLTDTVEDALKLIKLLE